jgi:invasion protein IalB
MEAMVLSSERARHARRIIWGAALCLLVSSSWAIAQTQQPKTGGPTALPPSQGKQTPSSQPSPSQWVVGCSNTESGLDCRAAQNVVYQQGQRRIEVSAVLRMLSDTKKPDLLLRLPLGVKLASGVTIQFGGSEAKAIAFQSCNLNGCMAEYPITNAEIASLQKGANLTLSVRTAQDAPIKFTLPAAGFAAAYAKVTGK